MCIETQNLGTALLPKFAFDIGYNVTLLELISAYQKNPGTETYQAVQQFLLKNRREKQDIMNTFSSGNRLDVNILDYEDNLLWSTAKLEIQDKIVLLYQASEYSSQSSQGSSYKKFEDGSEFYLSWVSGGPIFAKGGALKFGISDQSIVGVIDTTSSTPNIYAEYEYNSTTTMVVVSGNGLIYFNYPPTSIAFYMIGGGGGGGADGGGVNAGGGGGGGGYLNAKYTTTSLSYLSILIGDGGAGGTGYNGASSDVSHGKNGGDTSISFNCNDTSNYALAYGGGGGAQGKGSGGEGGCGGGGGSYSSGGGEAGAGKACIYISPLGTFSDVTNGSYDGGKGDDNNDDRGSGGGGGGAGGVGGTADIFIGGNGGAGEQTVTDLNNSVTIYFSGGGGGGAGYGDTYAAGGIGQNGGGDGGAESYTMGNPDGGNASTNPYYGGGGGGAANNDTRYTYSYGGNGAKGIVILLVTNP